MTRLHAGEHEGEPQRGLPERLPPGEHLLWQGAPDWRVLTLRGFHLPWLAGYFALLMAWRIVSTLADGGSAGQALSAIAWTLPLAGLALGFVVLLAWLVNRTTLYTLTDRRLVLRVGVVLSVSFNLPLRRIEAAQLLRRADGSGDIALRLLPSDRIGLVHLWPHARPWRLTRTEPMLRALPHVDAVAALLQQALAASLQADEKNAPPLARPEAAAHSRPGAALPHAA